MINLTPHAIVIVVAGQEITIPPSGTVARVETTEVETMPFNLGDDAIVPVVTRQFGEVTGLPDDGTPCIVSSLVLSAVPGRANVFAPDTGNTAIRNEKGQVIAVTRLVAA